MANPIVNIMGTEYPLATTLRVAYKVQGQNSHKPYSEVFSQLDSMPIEKQVGILYAAFEVANPTAIFEVTQQKFLDWYLDNYNVSIIMAQLKEVIGGILGKDLMDDASDEKEKTDEGN